MKRWREIRVEVASAASDAAGAHLVDRGAPGLIEEPGATPGTTRLRAHFPEETWDGSVVESLRAMLGSLEHDVPGASSASIDLDSLDDEDWADGWRIHFPPIEVGERLRIRTPWDDGPTDERLDVVIEPAMAFGTGQHATTFGVLGALERVFASTAVESMLDVGTGSGVLAIAGAKLGARRVLGLDNDPIAVEAAIENVQRSGVEGTVTIAADPLEQVTEPFDLIVANLFARLLVEFAGDLARVARPGATLVVSGFLGEDRERVTHALEAAGWLGASTTTIENWGSDVFRRPG